MPQLPSNPPNAGPSTKPRPNAAPIKPKFFARSVSFVLVEKSSVTGVVDIDPDDKLIKVFPNPSTDGKFVIRKPTITPQAFDVIIK